MYPGFSAPGQECGLCSPTEEKSLPRVSAQVKFVSLFWLSGRSLCKGKSRVSLWGLVALLSFERTQATVQPQIRRGLRHACVCTCIHGYIHVCVCVRVHVRERQTRQGQTGRHWHPGAIAAPTLPGPGAQKTSFIGLGTSSWNCGALLVPANIILAS